MNDSDWCESRYRKILEQIQPQRAVEGGNVVVDYRVVFRNWIKLKSESECMTQRRQSWNKSASTLPRKYYKRHWVAPLYSLLPYCSSYITSFLRHSNVKSSSPTTKHSPSILRSSRLVGMKTDSRPPKDWAKCETGTLRVPHTRGSSVQQISFRMSWNLFHRHRIGRKMIWNGRMFTRKYDWLTCGDMRRACQKSDPLFDLDRIVVFGCGLCRLRDSSRITLWGKLCCKDSF